VKNFFKNDEKTIDIKATLFFTIKSSNKEKNKKTKNREADENAEKII